MMQLCSPSALWSGAGLVSSRDLVFFCRVFHVTLGFPGYSHSAEHAPNCYICLTQKIYFLHCNAETLKGGGGPLTHVYFFFLFFPHSPIFNFVMSVPFSFSVIVIIKI